VALLVGVPVLLVSGTDSSVDFVDLLDPLASAPMSLDARAVSAPDAHWVGGDEVALERVPPGARIRYRIDTKDLGRRRLEVGHTVAPGAGDFGVYWDGAQVAVLRGAADAKSRARLLTRPVRVSRGEHALEFRNLGTAPGPTSIGLDTITWRAAQPPLARWIGLALLLAAIVDLLASPHRRAGAALIAVVLGACALAAIVPAGDGARPITLEFPADPARVALRMPVFATWVTMPRTVFVGACLTCIAAVVFGSSDRRRRTFEWVRSRPGPSALGALFLAVTLTPSTEGWPRVARLLLAAAAAVPVIVGAASLVRSDVVNVAGRWTMPVRRLCRGIAAMRPGPFVAMVAAVELVLACAASTFLFDRVPQVDDTATQVFQAKMLAEGRVKTPVPEPYEFFEYNFMVRRGDEWFGKYPPGHPALLALGVLVHAPWIVNPIAGAVLVALVFLLGCRLYDVPTAKIAAGLGLASPFVLFMSSEFMSHATAAAIFLVFLVLFVETVRSPRVSLGLAAGAALGFLVCTRPLTAAGLAVPYVIVAVALLVRGARKYAPALVVMATSALAGVAVLLAYNEATTGSAWVSGYEALHGTAHNPGFGHAGWGPALTPAIAVANSLTRMNALNEYLFVWPIPSLLLLAAWIAAGRWNRWDGVLFATFAGLAFAYFFYWLPGSIFGPRFVYEAVGCVLLLSARGVRALMTEPGPGEAPARARHGVATMLFVCWVYTLAVSGPQLVRIYARDYWKGVGKHVVREVRSRDLRDAVVLVPRAEFVAAFAENDPSFEGEVIFARDTPNPVRLERAYPDRAFYRWREGRLELIRPAPVAPPTS
jgi:hypothetical protein